MKNGYIRDETPPGRLRSFRELRTDAVLSWPPQGKGVTNGAQQGVTNSAQQGVTNGAQQGVTNGAVHLETPPPRHTKRHTATRRLCAGTYLDREFRERLLRDVYNCRKRRVAPSYGYDLAQVLRYGWRAWRLELARDAVAVALVVVAVLTVPLGTLLTVGLLGVWYALRACWRVLVEWVRVLREGKSYDRVRGVRFRARVAAYWLLGSTLVVGGAVLAMRLSLQGSRLRDDLVETGRLIAMFVLLFVITGAFRQWQLVRLHHPSAVKGRLHSWRLRTIAVQQNYPVTIYSGYRPFVGSGRPVVGGHWSFAQRLVREKKLAQDLDEEFPPSEPPFTTEQIVGRLKESINTLASISHSETRLPGLTVRDRVFIDGTYVNEAPKDILNSLSLPPVSLKKIMEHPREEVRHHIECQIEAWDGELVTTVFVHISLQGRTLYVEFSTYALTPTPPQFHMIDEVGSTGLKAALRMVVHDLLELPDVVQAPRRLAATPKRLVNACWAQWAVTVKGHEDRDMGAQISARQIAADGVDNDSSDVSARRSRLPANQEETNYYQDLDVFRHSKIIERQLLAAIEAFLKEKGVDTSEFARRAEAILNNGVLNTGSGGTINIGDNNVFGYQSSVGGRQPGGPQPGAGGAMPAA
ncbi:MAG: hypothetical protein WBR33_21930 [Pseudonocardiaceae bacterium]